MQSFKLYIIILYTLLTTATLSAQSLHEVAHAATDKELYLTGERLHISISITDSQQQPLTTSRVAYVELTDSRRLCAQAMIALDEGRGWGEMPLPASLHSGNYLLSVYTRAMLNDGAQACFHKVISVVNVQRTTLSDEVTFAPADTTLSMTTVQPSPSFDIVQDGDRKSLVAHRPAAAAGKWASLSLVRQDLTTPDYSNLHPSAKAQDVGQSRAALIPEVEGHVVLARPTSQQTMHDTRLVMVGRMAAVYDGQLQDDGSWAYYTSGLHGTLPTLINAYDDDGKAIPMEFVSPYARMLPESLPRLVVNGSREQLLERSLGAQREQTISDWLAIDTLGFKSDYLSSKPRYEYDLDEWTNFSSVREILIEFIRGVQRRKVGGVNQLFTVDPISHTYSNWPALVLLDGMPVYDIDEILEYDARLLKYVQIYTDRYFFGQTICQGIISFISRKGRLSNYKLDAGSRLVSYAFPQQRPTVYVARENTVGTLYWNPDASAEEVTLPALRTPGRYLLIWQYIDDKGQMAKEIATFDFKESSLPD